MKVCVKCGAKVTEQVMSGKPAGKYLCPNCGIIDSVREHGGGVF